jgi:hypothetical protein
MMNPGAQVAQFAFWLDFLRRVWRPDRYHLIDLILDTGRVRENWVQGDVFLAARTSRDPQLPFFYCNYSPWGYGGSVDWSYWNSKDWESDDPGSGARPVMLAELKFLGGDYAPKTFAGEGFDLSTFLSCHEGQCITPQHSALTHTDLGGLVEDYRRLWSYRRHQCPARMFVLPLDTRRLDTLLGQCLDRVEFDEPGQVVVKADKWLCKAWHIKETIVE